MQMGKLLVFESGAVKLQLGDVLLDVRPGSAVSAHQELAAVNTQSGNIVFLAPVTHRAVCSPDISQLLACGLRSDLSILACFQKDLMQII